MKIRLQGTNVEINETITLMEKFLNIVSISGFYPSNHGKYSAEGRVYS